MHSNAQVDELITETGMKPGHATKFRFYLGCEREALTLEVQ